ncbi:hypothetical protein AB8810_10955 [Xanthomonas sp. NCPPB 3005]|uniref:hypothetical protein n=1 Tax=Xanthomonas sp. NCPPB 3005 TaxID=3240913 RepID=UPI0035123906
MAFASMWQRGDILAPVGKTRYGTPVVVIDMAACFSVELGADEARKLSADLLQAAAAAEAAVAEIIKGNADIDQTGQVVA